MFDLLIRNATLVDGSGGPSYTGDLVVTKGKIAAIGALGSVLAREVVNGTGLCLAPGFIDAHSHGDMALGQDCNALSKLCQGITTEIAGQCGTSPFPVDLEVTPDYGKFQKAFGILNPPPEEAQTSFSSYQSYANSLKLRLNTLCFTGHGNLRMAAMGMTSRAPNAEELEKMKCLLREAMEAGSPGLSSGLIYVPGCYAQTWELVELCKVVKEYDGIYTTHMRNESNQVLKSVEESIQIARESGVRLWISHVKIMGKPNWGGAGKFLISSSRPFRRGCLSHWISTPIKRRAPRWKSVCPPGTRTGETAILWPSWQTPRSAPKCAGRWMIPPPRLKTTTSTAADLAGCG